jgi:hypothetical protein
MSLIHKSGDWHSWTSTFKQIMHCSGHFKKSDCGNSAIYKKMVEVFTVWLAPSDRMIPLEVFGQRERERERERGKEREREREVTTWSWGPASFSLPKVLHWWIFVWGQGGLWSFFGGNWSQRILRYEVYAILACSNYYLKKCMSGETTCISTKLEYSVSASVPALSPGTF